MADEPNWLDELRNSDFGKAVRQQCDEQEDAPGDRESDGWKGAIYGACPIQGHGSVDRFFWYFRARHDDWRFEVYDAPCEGALPGDERLIWSAEAEYEGQAPNAGWMKYSEAWSLIETSITMGRSMRWATPNGGQAQNG